MPTMQAFHQQLFSTFGDYDPYMTHLAQLTQASRQQLSLLNLEWNPW